MAGLEILKKTLGSKGPLCSDALQFATCLVAARAFHFWVNFPQDDTLYNVLKRVYRYLK